jgi:protein-tyrosine phosphatase
MIDLHSHILHGLDDGARTLEESLAMARLAVADGITVIAATPHSPASTACLIYEPAVIRARTSRLVAALAAEQIALQVVVGTEIACEPVMAEKLARGTLLPYAGTRTVLLEPPWGRLPANFATAVFTLQLAGYRVLLAHPERLPDVQDDPNVLVPLVERGVLVQLTAQALTGGQGEYMRELAETLLTHGLVHVLASDAHGPPPRRTPALAYARQRATALVGEAVATALVLDTPRALLDGLAVTPPLPQRVSRRPRRR